MRAVTGEAVANWLRLAAASRTPEEMDVLDVTAGAVSEFVDDLPSIRRMPGDAGDWTASTQLGALMLASRLWRRRSSPAGIEAFGENGVAYTSRYDPDVARLLRLNQPQTG